MLKTTKDQISEDAPIQCEGDGCTSSDFDYRMEFDVYACETCYEKAMREFMGVFK